MKKLLTFLALFLSGISFAQNSAPYQNTSVIQLQNPSASVKESLSHFEVVSMACRHDDLADDIIVNQEVIDWLNTNNVSYKMVISNLKAKIDHDNAIRAELAHNKDGEDWYNVYRTFDEIQEKIDLIASNNSIASEIYLGSSYEGNPINGLKLSTGGANKPAVFFNGCQHAREWISPMANVYLADFLCQNNIGDNFTQSVLDLVDVYIVPVVNPDGYIYSHTNDRYWRKNRQPNTGSSCVGTDLNRNWDADWAGPESTSSSPCSDIYVGTQAFSAPEALVLKNYMESIPNLIGHIDIHAYSALVLGARGYTNVQTPDHAAIVELGTAMNSAISNTHNYSFTFGTGDANGQIYLASGTMPDWSYDAMGTLGYTYELRPATSSEGGFELPTDQILDACEESYNGAFQMILDAANIVAGCTNSNACNYDPNATSDDGSCAQLDECGDCGGDGPAPGYDCDGNCISGDLLTINMYDTYGDGWNGNVLDINGVTHGFTNGSSATSSMCYDLNACSIVSCGGGTWQEEVSWVIINSDGQELASGGAPYEGEFGNCSDDVYGCNDTNAINYNVDATIDDGSCEYSELLPEGWEVTITGANHTMVIDGNASMSIEGNSLELGDAIGMFFTNSDGELQCGGYVLWTGETNSIAAQSDDSTTEPIDGFTTGEAFTWMIWDASEDMYYMADAIYDITMPNQGAFVTNGISALAGLSSVPASFEQIINMPAGWYIISSYIAPEEPSIDSVLSPIVSELVIAKDGEGLAYLPDWNFNGIGDLENHKGYLIKCNASIDLNIIGQRILPQDFILNLNEGWNMFSYLRDTSGDLVEMLASIQSQIIIVKTFDGTAYLPDWNFNGIGDMTPGEGYQIKLMSDVNFSYPVND